MARDHDGAAYIGKWKNAKSPTLEGGPGWKLYGSGGERRGFLGDGRLAVGRLVLVDDALAHGAVELARGVAEGRGCGLGVTAGGGLVEPADSRLQDRKSVV